MATGYLLVLAACICQMAGGNHLSALHDVTGPRAGQNRRTSSFPESSDPFAQTFDRSHDPFTFEIPPRDSQISQRGDFHSSNSASSSRLGRLSREGSRTRDTDLVRRNLVSGINSGTSSSSTGLGFTDHSSSLARTRPGRDSAWEDVKREIAASERAAAAPGRALASARSSRRSNTIDIRHLAVAAGGTRPEMHYAGSQLAVETATDPQAQRTGGARRREEARISQHAAEVTESKPGTTERGRLGGGRGAGRSRFMGFGGFPGGDFGPRGFDLRAVRRQNGGMPAFGGAGMQPDGTRAFDGWDGTPMTGGAGGGAGRGFAGRMPTGGGQAFGGIFGPAQGRGAAGTQQFMDPTNMQVVTSGVANAVRTARIDGQRRLPGMGGPGFGVQGMTGQGIGGQGMTGQGIGGQGMTGQGIGGQGMAGPGMGGPGMAGQGMGGPGMAGPGMVGQGMGGPGMGGPGMVGQGMGGPGMGGPGMVGQGMGGPGMGGPGMAGQGMGGPGMGGPGMAGPGMGGPGMGGPGMAGQGMGGPGMGGPGMGGPGGFDGGRDGLAGVLAGLRGNGGGPVRIRIPASGSPVITSGGRTIPLPPGINLAALGVGTGTADTTLGQVGGVSQGMGSTFQGGQGAGLGQGFGPQQGFGMDGNMGGMRESSGVNVHARRPAGGARGNPGMGIRLPAISGANGGQSVVRIILEMPPALDGSAPVVESVASVPEIKATAESSAVTSGSGDSAVSTVTSVDGGTPTAEGQATETVVGRAKGVALVGRDKGVALVGRDKGVAGVGRGQNGAGGIQDQGGAAANTEVHVESNPLGHGPIAMGSSPAGVAPVPITQPQGAGRGGARQQDTVLMTEQLRRESAERNRVSPYTPLGRETPAATSIDIRPDQGQGRVRGDPMDSFMSRLMRYLVQGGPQGPPSLPRARSAPAAGEGPEGSDPLGIGVSPLENGLAFGTALRRESRGGSSLEGGRFTSQQSPRNSLGPSLAEVAAPTGSDTSAKIPPSGESRGSMGSSSGTNSLTDRGSLWFESPFAALDGLGNPMGLGSGLDGFMQNSAVGAGNPSEPKVIGVSGRSTSARRTERGEDPLEPMNVITARRSGAPTGGALTGSGARSLAAAERRVTAMGSDGVAGPSQEGGETFGRAADTQGSMVPMTDTATSRARSERSRQQRGQLQRRGNGMQLSFRGLDGMSSARLTPSGALNIVAWMGPPRSGAAGSRGQTTGEEAEPRTGSGEGGQPGGDTRARRLERQLLHLDIQSSMALDGGSHGTGFPGAGGSGAFSHYPGTDRNTQGQGQAGSAQGSPREMEGTEVEGTFQSSSTGTRGEASRNMEPGMGNEGLGMGSFFDLGTSANFGSVETTSGGPGPRESHQPTVRWSDPSVGSSNEPLRSGQPIEQADQVLGTGSRPGSFGSSPLWFDVPELGTQIPNEVQMLGPSSSIGVAGPELGGAAAARSDGAGVGGRTSSAMERVGLSVDPGYTAGTEAAAFGANGGMREGPSPTMVEGLGVGQGLGDSAGINFAVNEGPRGQGSQGSGAGTQGAADSWRRAISTLQHAAQRENAQGGTDMILPPPGQGNSAVASGAGGAGQSGMGQDVTSGGAGVSNMAGAADSADLIVLRKSDLNPENLNVIFETLTNISRMPAGGIGANNAAAGLPSGSMAGGTNSLV